MEKGKSFPAAELETFRVGLLERKAAILGTMGTLEDDAARRGASGDLSTLPLHLAELGSDSFEQNISLGLLERERHELQEIHEALARIEDGSFGICEECEELLPRDRLQAIPYARLCIRCKIKSEE